MRTLTKPLHLLTAGDLMTDTLVVVPQDMSLQGAAHRLIESQVSGAPVVDEEGRCVGVISAGDFVYWAGKEKNPKARPENVGCVCASWQIVEADQLCDETLVRHYMTSDPVTVIQSTPVQKLAQMMVDGHIHRLIVVDRQQKPMGVISSTDILAALARFEVVTPRRAAENVPASVRN